MAKFIEVHVDGDGMLVNLEHVTAIGIGDKGVTTILFDDGSNQIAEESYQNIKLMIRSAQGGIPTDTCKMC